MKLAYLVVLSFLLASEMPAPLGTSIEVSCPDHLELPYQSLPIVNTHPDFGAITFNTRVWLSGVTLFDGAPSSGASLVPTSVSPKGEVITWKLEKPPEETTWLTCDYADGVVRLTRNVGPKLSTCTANVKEGAVGSGRTIRMTCK